MLRVGDLGEAPVQVLVTWASGLKEIGNCYFKKGEFKSAVMVYETVLDVIVSEFSMEEEMDNNITILVNSCFSNLSACELKLGNYDTVISLCSVILARDRNNTKSLYRRGQAYARSGDVKSAMSDFEKALALAPLDKAIKIEISSLHEKNQRIPS
ncbi:uncharacterized protein [Spinacia oleracea]|uniref:peptidylprolyl isomerase n=1 Tax=Spinacia oleracea TaxID=3562 RepID=A0A9R0J4B9_SPIOL|nr:uncharacterized protein LOC110800000 [Spinacia oleracea]